MRLTTIIVTRGRVALLARTIRSLIAQLDVEIDLRVIIDDCERTRTYLDRRGRTAGAVHSVHAQYVTRSKAERSGPRRLAALRKIGLTDVETSFCAFLDDDNELESRHYGLLAGAVAESNSVAAHSWRTLWSRDGTAFPLTDRHPWSRDPIAAKRLFETYCKAGIYKVNSHVIRDQVTPFSRATSMVDTSEWLFTTAFLRQLRFTTRYTREDWLLSRAEDSKLLDAIVETGVVVPSTRAATLRYYLGGYSNDWTQEAAHIEGWVVSVNPRKLMCRAMSRCRRA
jgi:hypothetical protein